ncbi:DoxX family protein [Flexivirga meconopsidis]|uniref:DoxX family protein n=1 Tax=Flexivirga meconopsidis TaxID=2977121 RepID=UPI002240BAE4
MLVRRLARPMLASIFITGGYNTVRNPERVAHLTEPVVGQLRASVPGAEKVVPSDAVLATRINGGVQVAAGSLLAIGKFPRVSALALAGSIVPTTIAGHAFWAMDDPAEKAQHRVQFFKNLSILGGLLIAAVDTEGKPSVAWRSKQAAHQAADAVSSALPSSGESSQAANSFKSTFSSVVGAAKEQGAHLSEVAKERGPELAEAARERGATLAEAAREHGPVVADALREQGGDLSRRAQKRAAKAARQAQAQFA